MSDSYLTRETLLKRMKTMSDDEAWEEFVDMYRGFIFAIINKMRVREDDIDDLYQKVMIKIFEALPQFDYAQRHGMFRNWVYTIARNTVLSYFKKNDTAAKHKNIISVDYEYLSSQPSELDEMIEVEWQKHVAALAFNNVAQKVTEEMMRTFQANLENEPVDVTAEKLGISESSVYVYRMRVKNALVDEINNLRALLE